MKNLSDDPNDFDNTGAGAFIAGVIGSSKYGVAENTTVFSIKINISWVQVYAPGGGGVGSVLRGGDSMWATGTEVASLHVARLGGYFLGLGDKTE
ncbi:hypothetical protein QQS21_005988 [Conoideocrella luteorostrata]|uniref:Uncharacterized protein n=1 Tax=Conoideocrella luteorostrata TaxID=1105319 RepID=A0AAJ0CR89_9HYPO|nr:hypothetical protein QQS21_005988 [Conoideocrella luteorostrata]